MGEYILNRETRKIELHFDKSEYLALSEKDKKEIKSNFLWSNRAKAWVSRSVNNHYRALKVAENLGLTDGGKTGDRLSYEEELERKAERAEARAERYDGYSANAAKRAVNLQADFNKYRQDWSWLTQPIISGHSGSQAFANHRNKVMRRYERGFEEYSKSEYYQERAATARATADNFRLKDKVYLVKQIKSQKSILRKYQNYIDSLEKNLYRIQQGEELKMWNGDLLTIEGQEKAIENTLEKYDYEYSKLEFFEKCLSDLGGIEFSKENINVGYIVNMKRWGRCEIVSAGPVNVSFKILDGGAAGGILTKPYAAIVEIIEKREIPKIKNPYNVGDILYTECSVNNKLQNAYQVLKVTETTVKIQPIVIENNKPIKNKFIDSKPIQKKIIKSKWRNYIGFYINNYQIYKYKEVTE